MVGGGNSFFFWNVHPQKIEKMNPILTSNIFSGWVVQTTN